MNQKVLLVAVAAGAYFLFSKKVTPSFHDETGQKIGEIQCGKPIYFNVPGYDAVWLSQIQNGQPQWNGPINIPYGPHELNCSTEPGLYQSAVYELTAEGTKGRLLGQTELRVIA